MGAEKPMRMHSCALFGIVVVPLIRFQLNFVLLTLDFNLICALNMLTYGDRGRG